MLLVMLSLLTIGVHNEGMILPFYSIKVLNDNIYVTLDSKIEKWEQLLSIDNYGADSIVAFAKKLYGSNNCDYEISCYKYNIISNFEDVYRKVTGKVFPLHSSIELFDIKRNKQNGIDVENTSDKYKTNQNNLEKNIKSSKSSKMKIISLLSNKSIPSTSTRSGFLKSKEIITNSDIINKDSNEYHIYENILYILIGIAIALVIFMSVFYFTSTQKETNEIN